MRVYGRVEFIYFLFFKVIKLTNGKINLKEFIIAKEYRGRDTYDNARSIAACQIANKSLAKDPLAEPLTGDVLHRYKDRSYIILILK